MVVALPKEHKLLKATLAEVEGNMVPEQPKKLITYPVTAAGRQRFQALLPSLAPDLPDLRILPDTEPGMMSVWATPMQHQLLSEIVKQLDAKVPADRKFQLVTYSIKSADPNSVVKVVRTLFPQTPNRAGPEDQTSGRVGLARGAEKVRDAIDQLDAGVSVEALEKVTVYSVKRASQRMAMGILHELVPDARITPDAAAGTLIVHARASDHKIIAKTLDDLNAGPDEKHAPRVEVYSLGSADPGGASRMLAQLVPTSRPIYNRANNTIAVWGTPEEQETLRAAVEKLAQKESTETAATAAVYELENMTASSVLSMVRQVAPLAKISVGSTPNQLTAWARPADQAKIKAIVDELVQQSSGENASKLVVYNLESPLSYTATRGLAQVFPQAKFTTGANPRKLIVWAKPKDHEKIDDLVKQMTQRESAETAPKAVVYTLETTTAASAIAVLRRAFPEATFTVGSDHQQLIAMARPADQVLIKAAVEEMSQKESEATAAKTVVYTVTSGRASTVLSALRTAVPRARIGLGPDPQQLVVSARPDDHAKVKELLDQLARQEPDDTAATATVYELKNMTASSVLSMVRQVAPLAKLSVGSTPNQLVAWARPVDQAKIKAIVDELVQQSSGENANKLVVYNLESPLSYTATRGLAQVFPQAKFTTGANPRKLIVWAKPNDHEKIADLVKQMTQRESAETAPKAVVYTLETTTAASASVVLRRAFPEATFTVGSDHQQLIAMARPADQVLIKAAVEEMSQKEPEETAAKTVVYTVTSGRASTMISALRAAVPRARIGLGPDPQQLVVSARPDDHAKVKELLDQLAQREPDDTAATATVYELKNMTASSVIAMVRQVAPLAKISVGSTPNQLVAWARPVDQAKIKAIVDELVQQSSGENANKLVVYNLESPLSYTATRGLAQVFPQAKFTTGANPRKLIVWAKPNDHEKIDDLVKQMTQRESAETAPKAVVYTLETTTAASASVVLRRAFPEATFTVGSDRQQLIAMARPADQILIKAAVEEMSHKEPEATAPKMEVYTLESAGASAALAILRRAFPEATFSVGADAKNLIAWARPDKQLLIKMAVEQIEAAGSPNDKRVMAVYPMRYEDTASLLRVLDPLLRKHATFVTDRKRDGLVVWADPEHQESIKKAIDDFTSKLPKTREPVSRVYHFESGDPKAAMTVLMQLVPTARMAVNARNRSLVVSALPEDQEHIKATVDEMERTATSGQAAELRAHRVSTADPEKLFGMLRTFFRRRPEVELTLDEENDMVMAMASPTDHAKIRSLIAQVEEGGTDETTAQLETYSVKNVDTVALMEILNTLLEKQKARVQLSLDPRSDQLVAIARPKEHQIVRETVEKLRGEEKQLEILQLNTLELNTAVTAIDRLFSDDGYGSYYDPNAPVVDTDEDTQQLFINATEAQHAKIRQLLVKMGETELRRVSVTDSDTTRVVPFGGDIEATLREIQRVWPRLRDNPLRVAEPSGAGAEKTPAKEESPKVEPKKEPRKEAPKQEPREKPDNKSAAAGSPRRAARFMLVGQKGTTNDRTKQEQPAPVMLIPGEGSITVRSDDPEALRQMESLLRSLSPKTSRAARNIEVFTLKHTDAVRTAKKLEDLFRRMAPRGHRRGDSRTTIVADERLNAVVVRGSRSDRATAAALLKTLDVVADESVQSVKVIPLRKANASQVQQALDAVMGRSSRSSRRRRP